MLEQSKRKVWRTSRVSEITRVNDGVVERISAIDVKLPVTLIRQQ